MAQIFFQAVGEMGVTLGALFCRDGLDRRTKGALIPLRSGTNQVHDEVGSGHGSKS